VTEGQSGLFEWCCIKRKEEKGKEGERSDVAEKRVHDHRKLKRRSNEIMSEEAIK
jgi:hypothetical protein